MSFLTSFVGWLGFYGPRDQPGTQVPIPLTSTASLAAPVTFDTAMQLSAFWACARLISETVAGLPIEFYSRETGAEAEARDVPLLRLLEGKVNRYQTRAEFLECMILNLCTHGNAYARITRDPSGEIISLLPLMAAQMECRTLDDGSRSYIYVTSSATVAYAESSIWHLRLFGNGIIGMSPLAYARNALGIGLASEKRVSQVFLNGAKPAGILMYDKVLTPTQRTGIRDSFKELVEGNDDSLLVLEAGMKFEAVSMSPQDIELLASRRFQIEDVCRFMGVPSVLVNDTASSTTWGSGIEQIIAGWYKLGLKPYLTRIEQSMAINLMTPEERVKWEVEFDFDELLRADPKARFDAYQSAINAGIMTPNEAREEEGRAPLDGGDELLINSTMVPISRVGEPPEQRVPAQPPSVELRHAPQEIEQLVKILGAATGETFVQVEESMAKHSRTMTEVADSLRDLAVEMRQPRKRTMGVRRGTDGRVELIYDHEE